MSGWKADRGVSWLLGLCAIAALSAGCTARQYVLPVSTLVPVAGAPTANCISREVLPTIDEVQPATITPGSEIMLSGSGGYFKDSCGGYNESARLYQVYLDNEPAGELQCYAGLCQAKFKLPERAGPGRHCLGVQKGTCQMELVVVEN